VLVALIAIPATRELTSAVIADAFWQVAVYVALTLTLFYGVASRLSDDSRFSRLLRSSPTLQVVFAASMGVLPGCGGAIIVMTQFVKGHLSFSAVVAVLTATMGDAAFLLLASRPGSGAFVLATTWTVGVLFGLLIDRVHEPDFMRPVAAAAPAIEASGAQADTRPVVEAQGFFWLAVLVPATAIAILGSFQVDVDALFGLPASAMAWLGAGLGILTLMLWALGRPVSDASRINSGKTGSQGIALFQKVAHETNFVFTWVVFSFLLFELTIWATDWNLAALFGEVAILMPLMGVLIGLLPGCGPQILVTTLYVSGAIPMSAQLGNAISNDGDALFPAIALAPRAAMLATLYTALPALAVAYGYAALFELGL
jgi:hypothetical protein